jgi:hypothetical protein
MLSALPTVFEGTYQMFPKQIPYQGWAEGNTIDFNMLRLIFSEVLQKSFTIEHKLSCLTREIQKADPMA